MFTKIKNVFQVLWQRERRLVFWLLVASLIIVIFMMIFYATSARADSFDICVAECISDVMQVEDCIWDEKAYWDISKSSEFQLRRSCQELIRNERDYCTGGCAKKATNSLLEYYDKEVKNFPDVNL